MTKTQLKLTWTPIDRKVLLGLFGLMFTIAFLTDQLSMAVSFGGFIIGTLLNTMIS